MIWFYFAIAVSVWGLGVFAAEMLSRPPKTAYPVYQLREWAIINDKPYQPPERSRGRLVGKVYGHPVFPDGYNITTSHIVEFDRPNRVVKTKHGTHYKLGTADPKYSAWTGELDPFPRWYDE